MLLFPDTADESYPVPVKLTWGEVDFLPVTWITRFFNALRLTAIKQLHFSYDLKTGSLPLQFQNDSI